MESIDKQNRIQHLAGIVPVGGQPLDFKLPWHDCMMPISPDYLAVERAVIQSVLAGCQTVWVVSHLGTQPLLRKRIGDTITSPYNLIKIPTMYMHTKEISIYYVPIHPKDRAKRDCLGWSVLYGADSAFRISKFMSKWIAPERFFCSFPYGIVPDEVLKENLSSFSTRQKFIFSYEGKSVKDNLHLPFTFDADDYFRCRDMVKHKQAQSWGDISARFYDIATVFSGLDTTNSTILNLPWFYDISSWSNYRKYLASEHFGVYNKPKELFKGNKRKFYE